jgi:outer membrane protein
MKRLYTLLLLTGLWSAASAQQGGQSFTLEQCIQYALENSITVKNSVVDEQIADSKVKETRGVGLPQIDGSVSLNYNDKLPRFFATKRTAANFAGVATEEDYNNFLPGVGDNDVVALQNFFQLKGSGNAGINITQLLFSSSYLLGLKAASAYRDLAFKNTQASRETTIQGVTKAYYTCLINKDRITLYDANIARVDSLLRSTTAMNKNGFSEEIDVDRIQVQLNNLNIDRNNFYSVQEVAIQLLKFQMNYPQEQPLEVAGDISSIQIDENLLSTYAADWDYSKRSDYQVLEANRKLLALDVKNMYAAGVPTLSASANFGYMTQSPNISGLFKTNSNFEDNGTMGPDKWYSTTTYGLTLNVPLFSGLQRTYKVQQARLNLMKTDNNLKQIQQSIDLDVRSTASVYTNAVRSLTSQRQNRVLAEKIARVTKIKYQQGVGSNIEVTDAENSLKTAQINYYNALFDALIAKVDLDKAYGKFNTQPTETK